VQFDDSNNGPFGNWLEKRVKEKVGEDGTKVQLFGDALRSNISTMMLFCIPLFAFVLKILYLRQRRFYIEHLVYALHIHAFFYMAVLVTAFGAMAVKQVAPTLEKSFIWLCVLAIVALAAGYYYGLGILDPISGLVGAIVIASWSYGLIRDSAMVLLDADADPKQSDEIRGFLEHELKARIPDLHLWRLGPGHRGLIVSLISPDMISAESVKATLRRRYPDLSHVTVEVAVCADCT